MQTFGTSFLRALAVSQKSGGGGGGGDGGGVSGLISNAADPALRALAAQVGLSLHSPGVSD